VFTSQRSTPTTIRATTSEMRDLVLVLPVIEA
jgi:hypothetical protein